MSFGCSSASFLTEPEACSPRCLLPSLRVWTPRFEPLACKAGLLLALSATAKSGLKSNGYVCLSSECFEFLLGPHEEGEEGGPETSPPCLSPRPASGVALASGGAVWP